MLLFKNRHLNIAILISASWHLICIFSIVPILYPISIKKNTTSISFLGSILERFNVVPERSFSLDAAPMAHVTERRNDTSPKDIALSLPGPLPKIPASQSDKKKIVFVVDKYENINFGINYKKSERPLFRSRAGLIEGEARNRAVMHKPDLDKLKIVPALFISDYNAKVRFKISRHGFVEMPECVISSGSPDFDQMAIRYVRKWQFVPQYEGPDVQQEGLANINFSIEK